MPESDIEPEYEVERILADDIVDGQHFYLVKWLGYDDVECTWEPRSSFTTDEAVVEFQKAKANNDFLTDQQFAWLQERIDRHRNRESPDFDPVLESDGSGENHVVDERSGPMKRAKLAHNSMSSKTSHMNAYSRNDIHRTQRLRLRRPSISKQRKPLTTKPVKITTQQERAGQRFRSLRHQNNVRKRAQVEPAPNVTHLILIPASELASYGSSDTAHFLPVDHPEPIDDKSLLFFPEIRDVSVDAEILDHERQQQHTKKTSPVRIEDRISSQDTLYPQVVQELANRYQHANALPKVGLAVTGVDPGRANEPRLMPQSKTRIDTDPASSSMGMTHQSHLNDSPDSSYLHRQPQTARDVVRVTNVRRLLDARPGEPKRPTSGMARKHSVSRDDSTHKSDDNQRDIPAGWDQGQTWQQFSHGKAIVRARNGREWIKGDIICTLFMGKMIGAVRLAGLSWSCVKAVVGLERGSDLELRFAPQGFKRREFDALFVNEKPKYKGLGNVEPFDDTLIAIDQFSQYLENNDEAAVWCHPSPSVDTSVLLYSCRARSWGSVGERPARIGSSRLHVAFMQKVSERGISASRSAPVFATLSVPNTSRSNVGSQDHIVPTGTASEGRIARRSLDGSTEDSQQINSSLDNFISNAQCSTDFLSCLSPLDVQSRHVSPLLEKMSIPKDANYQQRVKALENNTAVPKLTLDYKRVSLVELDPKSSVRKQNPQFFIAFSRSHLFETVLLRKWLEAHASVNCVFTNDVARAWDEFRTRAQFAPSIIFFHEENPEFYNLEGLGKALQLAHLRCYSTSFGRYTTGSPIAVNLSDTFTRGSVILITETNITDSLDSTLFIVNWFIANKNPGWQIMFRPLIKHWIRDRTLEESDAGTRDKLIELLALIQAMVIESRTGIAHPMFSEIEENNSYGDDIDVESTSYMRSPSSLPGYVEARSLRARDDILLDYFCGFALYGATRYRRFMAFSKVELDVPNSHHVLFDDPDVFRSKNDKPRDKSKPRNSTRPHA